MMGLSKIDNIKKYNALITLQKIFFHIEQFFMLLKIPLNCDKNGIYTHGEHRFFLDNNLGMLVFWKGVCTIFFLRVSLYPLLSIKGLHIVWKCIFVWKVLRPHSRWSLLYRCKGIFKKNLDHRVKIHFNVWWKNYHEIFKCIY